MNLAKNTANKIKLHYRPKSEKTNDEIFQQMQKIPFLVHFLGKDIFK